MRIPKTTQALRNGETFEMRSPDASEGGACLEYIRALSREAFRNLNHPPEVFESMTAEAESSFLEECGRHPRAFFLAAYLDDRALRVTRLSTLGVLTRVAELPDGFADEYLYQRDA